MINFVSDQFNPSLYIDHQHQNNMKSTQFKYTKLLSPEEFGFMEYYMLPQKDQFQYVYRPGDDSFLMLSVIKNQITSFPTNSIICEIGSGSGILSAHISKWLKQIKNEPFMQFATDISPDACLLSCKYYQQYNLEVQQICTSLLKGITCKPNVIICNPPYVPTEIQQKQTQLKYLTEKYKAIRQKLDYKRSPNKNLIAYSYMGGPEGLDTTRKLINSINFQTILYIIVMGQQGLQTLKEQVQSKQILSEGYTANFEPIQYYKKYNQQLYVVLITFKKI